MPRQPLKQSGRPKESRLRKRADFVSVASTDTRWVSETVIIQYKPADGPFRFGVTATKKIGNAVLRNRCKRRMRAAIATITHDTPLCGGDIVVIARPAVLTCSWDKLLSDTKWCLKRLGLVTPKPL